MSKFPITLVSCPLLDEPATIPNRSLCIRQLDKNKWCVCYLLRDVNRYYSGHYFKTKRGAQECFNLHMNRHLERYQENANLQERLIKQKDFLIKQISNSLSPLQKSRLVSLAEKVAKLDSTTNKYRLCSLLLARGFRSSDPDEIIEIINDVQEELNNSLISIL